MPRETIRISLSNPFLPEPGAIFLSTLAYPDRLDAIAREEFRLSLCRQAVLTRCEVDPGWAMTPQIIRPDIFSGPDSDWDNAYNRGRKKLEHRYIAAAFIALPHLVARFGGPKEFEGYNVTVQNMSYLAMDFMGWEGDSESTLKSKIWGPSRPVVHAAAAYIQWAFEPEEVLPPIEQRILAFPEALEGILKRSEIFRLGLPLVQQFTIKEEDTIQFLSD